MRRLDSHALPHPRSAWAVTCSWDCMRGLPHQCGTRTTVPALLLLVLAAFKSPSLLRERWHLQMDRKTQSPRLRIDRPTIPRCHWAPPLRPRLPSKGLDTSLGCLKTWHTPWGKLAHPAHWQRLQGKRSPSGRQPPRLRCRTADGRLCKLSGPAIVHIAARNEGLVFCRTNV